MNESTLVPREEMSDLDWLARNVHEWPAGEHQPWCYVYMTYGGVMKAAGNFLDAVAKPTMITIDQWLARRAELQNKPTDWPDGANWLAQDKDGEWYFYKDTADNPPQNHGEENWFSDEAGDIRCRHIGEVLGDWRDTLEKRPAELSEQAVTARLKEAADNVLAAAPELMTDKYKFEPFVSAEDAATAKQHDQVNSPSHYASGGIECIEAIKASMSHEAFLGYLKGNVQKYMWRYEKKVNPAEDLKKAQWYLSKLIEEQKQC